MRNDFRPRVSDDLRAAIEAGDHGLALKLFRRQNLTPIQVEGVLQAVGLSGSVQMVQALVPVCVRRGADVTDALQAWLSDGHLAMVMAAVPVLPRATNVNPLLLHAGGHGLTDLALALVDQVRPAPGLYFPGRAAIRQGQGATLAALLGRLGKAQSDALHSLFQDAVEARSLPLATSVVLAMSATAQAELLRYTHAHEIKGHYKQRLAMLNAMLPALPLATCQAWAKQVQTDHRNTGKFPDLEARLLAHARLDTLAQVVPSGPRRPRLRS